MRVTFKIFKIQVAMKKPKHLSMLTDAQFAGLQTGFDRFQFGFAEPGETWEGDGIKLKFVGNFKRKKDAVGKVAELGVKVNPYLNGKLKIGWVVWQTIP
jgi:hypothetical protein